MTNLSISLLIAGGARVVLWALLAYVAVQHGRRFLLVGAAVSVFNSAVFAFSNAGGHVPKPLFTAAAYLATPAIALVVTGIVIGMRNSRVMRAVLANPHAHAGGAPSPSPS